VTITDNVPMVVIDPLPIRQLTAGMAVMVFGEWHHVVDVYRDDTGHTHASFAPGTGIDSASFDPGEQVWAYPDWQVMADLAMTLAVDQGPAGGDVPC